MDYSKVSSIENKSKIAIVCIGYNRLDSIKRLLKSLDEAIYPNNDIPLVLSIDASGCKDLYEYVNKVSWNHGSKYVNIEETRLGLKKHIFQCAGLSKYFKAVILLEDDTCVSPYYYHYVLETVDFYSNDDNIAEIALYKNSSNGYVQLPFEEMHDGYDTLLKQDVCTSGECFTYEMWEKFENWMETHSDVDIESADMQPKIKTWTRAWSKYYNAYVVNTHRYVVYPRTSLTTNFNDVGEHGFDPTDVTQVALSWKSNSYRLLPSEKMIRYDIFDNNELIYDWIGYDKNEVCLDIYGSNPNINKKRYLLSSKILPYKIVKTYGLRMHPIELNIKYDIDGEGLSIYDTNIEEKHKEDGLYHLRYLQYFAKDLGFHHMKRIVLSFYKNRIISKIRICTRK